MDVLRRRLSMKLSLALLALSLLTAVGCDSARPELAGSQSGDALQIELGTTVFSDGLSITFDAVASDSRCPADAECVWAGEARVRLQLDGDTEVLLVADPAQNPDAGLRRGNVILRATALSPSRRVHDTPQEDPPVVSILIETVSG